MSGTNQNTLCGERVAFSFAEVAQKVGKHRAWVYRQVKAGKIKAVTGYGSGMIAAAEIERVFGKEATL